MSHRPHRPVNPPPTRAPAPATPENKTLAWHKQTFATQQKAWQKQTIEGRGTQQQASLDMPFPIRRVQTDDRGTLRIANPDVETADVCSTTSQRGDVARSGASASRGAVLQTRSEEGSIRRKPVGGGPHDALVSSAPLATPRAAVPAPVRAPRAHKPASSSSAAMQKTHRRARTERLPPVAGSPGLLGVPLSVYGFRGSLPEELQPASPPLRWDEEPAPQIPPLASDTAQRLCEDAELAKFMTADKSDLQPFEEKMPVATVIVKGQLGEFVAR